MKLVHIIQHNSIAQYSLATFQLLCTVYNMSITNFCVYNFAYVQNVQSTVLTAVHDLSFLKI
jgi:hypothetical protein